MISDFGRTDDGRNVRMVTIGNGTLRCTVLDLGCSLRSLEFEGRDVLLGYDDADSYLHNGGHFGGVIGRYANRIKDGRCPIGDEVFQLSRNRDGNHMHGGNDAFDKRVWHISKHDDSSVIFGLEDRDGSEGYPGNLHITCEYRIEGNSLIARYTATSDRDTVCNIINHAYFNLGDSKDVTDHTVRLEADEYTPLGEGSIPTGAIESVEGTGMDLRKGKQLKGMSGYDCNWVVRGYDGSVRPAGSAWCDSTGIRLDVLTNMPGIQFYTGNGIKEGTKGKNGSVYGRWSGLCLETQHFPDAPNHPNFPSAVLHEGETYEHITEYRFSRL
jgi:aldose 1-epimerase